MRIRRWLVLLTVFALFGAACSSDKKKDDVASSDDSVDGDAGDNTGTGWTIIGYSIADTNLEPFMMDDITEMSGVGTQDGLNIVALVDRAADYTSDPVIGIDDWVGGKVLEIGPGGTAEELQDMGDVDTGDPQVLSDFITQAIEDYPAAHYALVISDHGASWPGVGGDEGSGGNGLTLDEIDTAIGTGLSDAGVDKLDLLGFDACLMSTYEVASTMAKHADRMLASQELEPGHGWNYASLQTLADNPDATVDELGSAIIEGFEEQATEQGTVDQITLALTDLTKMGLVDEALAAFGTALSERGADVAPIVGQSLETNLGFGRSPDPSQDTFMTDLGGLAGQIGTEALDVSDQADALIQAINDAIVDRVEDQGIQGATGLSIYFPPQEWFSQDYLGIQTPAAWNDYLATYYSAGDAIPEEEQPRFTNADDTAETFFDEDGLNITGTFDLAAADNLSVATISYGIVNDDGSVEYIGEEPAAIADDGSGLALGIYDLTVLTISDGEDTTYAYLSLTQDEGSDTFTIDVPMAYYAPEDINGETYQDVLLTLTVDGETGDITDETYYVYDDDLGTYGELTAEPDGIVVPQTLTVDADGNQTWNPTSDVGLFADLPSLQYDLQPLDPGTLLHVDLTVTDFGGNSDTVSAEVSVP